MSSEILVIGGTGKVGTPLVAELVARGETVRIGTRNPEKAAGRPGAKAVYLDLAKPETLAAAYDGVDRVYVVSPTGEADQIGLLTPALDEALRRGIKVVLQTAIGVDADEHIPFRQLELKLERSGVPYVILRPNWFSDNFETYWLSHIRAGEIRLPAAEGKSSFIDARDIAAAAAAVMTSDRFDNKAYVLTGPEALGYAEAAVLLSAAAGRTIGYRSVDDATFISELIAAGLTSDYAQILAAIFYPVREGWTAGVTDAVTTLTGKAPRTLQAYIAENAGKFAAA